ncbi:MAG: BLUF domain-containing protein [Xanthomonadaceae bacterium]|jgi:hypothetical protein|nr:BLUF domain-containing protein [Xanthomonadaceae bacterium]
MKTIIYASWCQRSPTVETLLSILKSARANNAMHGISGVLLLVDAVFIQLLEGPAEAVDRLMGNIRRDPRHHEIVVLLDENQDARPRMFGDWSMAFCRLGAVDAVAGRGLQPVDLQPLLAVLDRFPERPASTILRSLVDANRAALGAEPTPVAGRAGGFRAQVAPTG